MKTSFEERIARQKADMAASDQRNRWLLIAIVVGFAVVALFFALKRRVASGPIDVNRATAAELERIPGVGPAMAKDIVKGRPYQTAEDLLKVKGIGPKTLEKMRSMLLLPAGDAGGKIPLPQAN